MYMLLPYRRLRVAKTRDSRPPRGRCRAEACGPAEASPRSQLATAVWLLLGDLYGADRL